MKCRVMFLTLGSIYKLNIFLVRVLGYNISVWPKAVHTANVKHVSHDRTKAASDFRHNVSLLADIPSTLGHLLLQHAAPVVAAVKPVEEGRCVGEPRCYRYYRYCRYISTDPNLRSGCHWNTEPPYPYQPQ